MTYLSRLILNPRSYTVRRELSDCQAMHERILKAFGEAPDRARAREHFGVLYRVDVARHGDAGMDRRHEVAYGEGSRSSVEVGLLVQARTEPNWSCLPGDYLDPDRDPAFNPACKSIDEAYASLRQGQRLAFRLRANPTKRRLDREGRDDLNGKRVHLRSREEQEEWLERKGEQGGFAVSRVEIARDVPDLLVLPAPRVQGKRDQKDLSFGAVLFEGTLRITDVDVMRKSLEQGIGSGKAYGFGLLSIAPV